MPLYRLQFSPPPTITYRNGVVKLETFCDPVDQTWIWRAVNENGVSVVLLQRETMLEFTTDRYEGFEVEAGTPAHKIMERLVRDGAAYATTPGAVRKPSARSRRR